MKSVQNDYAEEKLAENLDWDSLLSTPAVLREIKKGR